jgi:tetratricopeptide (TPR) repeat protein
MTRERLAAKGMILLLSGVICLFSRTAAAQTPPQDQKPSYTIAEYNAYQAAHGEKDLQARLKLLDDFVAKFPNSTLLLYIDQDYFDTYGQMKNYPKVMEWGDKLLALGDKLAVEYRINVAYTRCTVFQSSFNPKAPNINDLLAGTRTAADEGLKLLDELKKPETLSEEKFAEQKKVAAATFDGAGGFAALQQKDYPAAEKYFKASLVLNPNDAITSYRLGLAYLLQDPAKTMEGFWALARSVALKGPGEAQVRDYLRKRLLVYQQPGCDSLIDAQMNEMIQLAANSSERPATYTFPSSEDLNKVRQASTILTVLTDLKGGGDKAKLTWLTLCGAEFPEVVGKIIDVSTDGTVVEFKVFTGATEEEMQSASTANMDVKVEGHPESARLQKDDFIRFSGTLASYDPEPFLLHWEKVKVDPTIIPMEKAAPGAKRPKRPISRKPGAH